MGSLARSRPWRRLPVDSRAALSNSSPFNLNSSLSNDELLAGVLSNDEEEAVGVLVGRDGVRDDDEESREGADAVWPFVAGNRF